MQASSSVSRLSGAGKLQVARASASQRASGSRRLVVTAKVDLHGAPRVIRGKCFVTKDVSAAAGWSCCGCCCMGQGVVLRRSELRGGSLRLFNKLAS
jgi:hypothetical protein